MVERALELLQNRVDEIREILQRIDGPTARQMEQEMEDILRIICTFRLNDIDPE